MPAEIAGILDNWNIDERNVKFRAYALLPATEQGIHYAIDHVLAEKERPDLRFAVYMIVKELAMNAVKANLKLTYFSEINVGLEDGEQYRWAIKRFHDLLDEDWAFMYAVKSRERSMFVEICFICDSDQLTIRVVNNRPISDFELARFRKKLSIALAADDMQEYALSGGDPEEGAGMGLMLIVNILRSLDLPLDALQIGADGSRATVVQFQIPLLKKGEKQNVA